MVLGKDASSIMGSQIMEDFIGIMFSITQKEYRNCDIVVKFSFGFLSPLHNMLLALNV